MNQEENETFKRLEEIKLKCLEVKDVLSRLPEKLQNQKEAVELRSVISTQLNELHEMQRNLCKNVSILGRL